METNKKPGRKSKKKDITSEEIVERHLHDRSDIITTEDIQSVKVPPESEELNPEIIEMEESKDDNGKKVPERDITTPWDVIDE